MSRRSTRAVVTAGCTLLTLMVTAGAASADPAGPTHYRATITEVVALDGDPIDVEVEVLGGDAFLVVRAPTGIRVDVPGYEGEPYVRIDADGAVSVNTRSPARWLNDARYGAAEVPIPREADAAAPPIWELVAEGGIYAWHDHRVHFMSPALPPQVDAAAGTPQDVFSWLVPLSVDGRDVEVRGELTWLPGPPLAVPVTLVAAAVAVAVAAALRRSWTFALLVSVGAAAALVVGIGAGVGLPAGADSELALTLLPLLALAGAGLGLALGRSAATVGRGATILAVSAVPLGVWGFLLAGALTRPIVPGLVPVPLVRGAVLVALAAAAAGVVVLGRQLLLSIVLPEGAAPEAGASGGTTPETGAPESPTA